MNTTLARATKIVPEIKHIVETCREDYGYRFIRWQHVAGVKNICSACTVAIFNDSDDTENEVSVEMTLVKCPQCGDKAVAYGWSEGGCHNITCINEHNDCLDYENLEEYK